METSKDKMDHYRERGREVLVDFDGTLCEFNYPKLGPPRDGALKFILWLISKDLRPCSVILGCWGRMGRRCPRAAPRPSR